MLPSATMGASEPGGAEQFPDIRDAAPETAHIKATLKETCPAR